MKHDTVRAICSEALRATREQIPATKFIPFSRNTKAKGTVQRWLKYEVAFRMLDRQCPVRDVVMYLNLSAANLRREYVQYLCRDKNESN